MNEEFLKMEIRNAVRAVLKNAFDHGQLNLPLGSRARGGSLDSQIDKYKREKEQTDREKRREVASKTKTDKEEAREYGKYISDLAKSTAEKSAGKLKERDVKNKLESMMKWEPAQFITLMKRFKSERGY